MTDRQILAAYRLLAAQEGVFVEPASAASVAGLLKAAEQGLVDPGQKIVCTVTGNGLKDPDWAVAACSAARHRPGGRRSRGHPPRPGLSPDPAGRSGGKVRRAGPAHRPRAGFRRANEPSGTRQLAPYDNKSVAEFHRS